MYTICKVLVLPLVGSLNWHAQKRRLLKYDNEHFLFLGVKTERIVAFSGATRVGKIAERSKESGVVERLALGRHSYIRLSLI